MAEGTGTGEPERHQGIEDELSSLDTNFDLTSQGGREIAIPNTESQVGIANPDTHQATPSEVVVAGGDFKNAYFGPHTSTSHFEERTYVNPTFNYHFHSPTNQEASNSASQQLNTREVQENTELEEGYVRISDDTVMWTRHPICEGTNVYEGYQEHVSTDGGPTRLRVAIKKIPDSTDKDKKEVEHLATLASHPNVVRIIRSIEHKTPHGNFLYIVMQLCGLRNLQEYLNENRKNGTPFDFKKTLKFTKQLVKGMKHIHDNGIVHRDIKPENILLSTDGTKVMFADFGLGKKLRQGRTSTKVTAQGQGTTGYMAPETLSTQKVSKSGDIFSFGVTVFEVWSNGINPYGSDNISRDFNIMHNEPPDFSGVLLTGFLRNIFIDWIRKMLQHDPRLRPTIDEVLRHIFLINAKKSEEELLAISILNLGARTSSVDESARKQLETTDQKQLATTSNDQPERTQSTLRKQAETTDETKAATTSSEQQEQTESTLQNQAETTEKNEVARTSSDLRMQIESVPQKQADVRPKGISGFFRKIFGGTRRVKETVDLLERLPQTQDQQMKLLECYVQLGRISEALKCVENMRNLVARHPRPKAVDVYQLGLDNFDNSYHIKAIAYFACAAKIYSFELNADEVVRRMWDCSLKSSDAVEAMLKQGGMRAFARLVGMEIMNSIYCDVTEMSNANPDLKAEVEVCCLNNTGDCYRELELYEKAIEVYKRGIDIMNRQFGENSSKYRVFGLLLNNMGVANDNLRNYSEAESLYERSIDACKRAEDWPNDEIKKRVIGTAENNLHEARREKK